LKLYLTQIPETKPLILEAAAICSSMPHDHYGNQPVSLAYREYMMWECLRNPRMKVWPDTAILDKLWSSIGPSGEHC
jgi:hypothetical protein